MHHCSLWTAVAGVRRVGAQDQRGPAAPTPTPAQYSRSNNDAVPNASTDLLFTLLVEQCCHGDSAGQRRLRIEATDSILSEFRDSSSGGNKRAIVT